MSWVKLRFCPWLLLCTYYTGRFEWPNTFSMFLLFETLVTSEYVACVLIQREELHRQGGGGRPKDEGAQVLFTCIQRQRSRLWLCFFRKGIGKRVGNYVPFSRKYSGIFSAALSAVQDPPCPQAVGGGGGGGVLKTIYSNIFTLR
jgi:hypothetical protein